MTKQPHQQQGGQPRQAGERTSDTRQQQQYMADEKATGGASAIAAKIHKRMEVIGADGKHVGKVERVEADRLRLSADDWCGSDRSHDHYLPLDQVYAIEGDKVRLNLDAARAASQATIA